MGSISSRSTLLPTHAPQPHEIYIRHAHLSARCALSSHDISIGTSLPDQHVYEPLIATSAIHTHHRRGVQVHWRKHIHYSTYCENPVRPYRFGRSVMIKRTVIMATLFFSHAQYNCASMSYERVVYGWRNSHAKNMRYLGLLDTIRLLALSVYEGGISNYDSTNQIECLIVGSVVATVLTERFGNDWSISSFYYSDVCILQAGGASPHLAT